MFAAGHVLTDCMYIILKFLLDIICCNCVYFCHTLYPTNHLRVILCFTAPTPSLLRNEVYKFPWDATENMTRLAVIFPHILLLSKIDILLTK